jgi:hypothetical protein
MNEKDTLNMDEKLNDIVKYLNNNRDMIDIIHSKLYNTDEIIDEKNKKNDLIFKCILPFASYLHLNYDEAQLESINSSFAKSLRYSDI